MSVVFQGADVKKRMNVREESESNSTREHERNHPRKHPDTRTLMINKPVRVCHEKLSVCFLSLSLKIITQVVNSDSVTLMLEQKFLCS